MSNVILVSFDALRYDHVSYAGGKQDTTLFLGSVAEDGIWFDQHISTGSGTSTSFPGIHASSLPLDHGYAGLNPNHTSLAEVLNQTAVQTLGVTAQTSCSSLYDYDRGFDFFHDWVEQEGLNETEQTTLSESAFETVSSLIESVPIVRSLAVSLLQRYRQFNPPACPYRRATEITDSTLSLVDEHIDPATDFFIWVHYMEPHQPYYPPADCIEQFHDGPFDVGRTRRAVLKTKRARPEIIDGTMGEVLTASEIDAIKDFYSAATRYVDREARRLVEGFKSRQLLDDTTLIFTADHGDELFDHGDFGHPPKMYDELIHVPLIVQDTAGRFSQQSDISSPTSHLDLAPTIGTLLDADIPSEWQGRSLLEMTDGDEAGNREYTITELCHKSGLGGSIMLDSLVAAIRTTEWKYIQNRQRNTEQLYNLQKDPGERDDISDHNQAVVSELRETLEDRLANVSETTESVEITDKAKQRLQQLGYAEE